MPNSFNNVLIEGTLVRDPLSRITGKGITACNFSIASNRWYKSDSNLEKEVSFFDIKTYGKLAEDCQALGHKGCDVKIVGRLKQDRWTDNNGKACSKISIVAEHVEFKPTQKEVDEIAL